LRVAECYLPDAVLGEALTFEDGSLSLTFLKQQGATLHLALPLWPRNGVLRGLSVALICTATEPYQSHLARAVRHYVQVLDRTLPYEINVVYYGKSCPLGHTPPAIRVVCYPDEPFHMSVARNRSLQQSRYATTLMLDLDCYLNRAQLTRLLTILQRGTHHGVLNLKDTPQTGNGLWLGETALLQAHPYDERFQHAFFEDTAFMMQFSHQGIVPLVVQSDLTHLNHTRQHTAAYGQHNKALFFRLLRGEEG
jgi:hypothetical protein